MDVFRDQIMGAKSYNITMMEPHRTIPTSEAVSCFLSLHAKLLRFGSKDAENILRFFFFFSCCSSCLYLPDVSFLSPPCCPTRHNSIAGLFSQSTKSHLGQTFLLQRETSERPVWLSETSGHTVFKSLHGPLL